jgi:hypothetical protein
VAVRFQLEWFGGCCKEKGVTPGWHLLGYAALLVENLISIPVLASSFTWYGKENGETPE